jgi:hypothetical protein
MEIWRFDGEKARSARYIISHYVESIYFNQQILGSLANVLFILLSRMFVVETEWNIVAHIKELVKVEGSAPDR